MVEDQRGDRDSGGTCGADDGSEDIGVRRNFSLSPGTIAYTFRSRAASNLHGVHVVVRLAGGAGIRG